MGPAGISPDGLFPGFMAHRDSWDVKRFRRADLSWSGWVEGERLSVSPPYTWRTRSLRAPPSAFSVTLMMMAVPSRAATAAGQHQYHDRRCQGQEGSVDGLHIASSPLSFVRSVVDW